MKIPEKLELANLPTPLQKLKFDGKEFFVKRDDYTGTELSGNKVRKLEYILHDARKNKAKIIYTCGGEQSNHARATVIAAAKLGMKSKLFLWGIKKNYPDGNLFINEFIGAEIKYLNKKEFFAVDDLMFAEREKLGGNKKNVYVIPAGGSSTLGIWGYISFFDELDKQLNINQLKGIFAACGSGGTAAGLLVGAALKNLKLKIYAVNVLLPEKQVRKKILQLAEGAVLDYNLNCKIDEGRLKIVTGFSDEGYKKITDDKLKLISKFAQQTGIILDPVYTGKAFTAYHQMILKKGFGKNYLFLHTGGLFGVFSNRKQYLNCL